MIFYLLWIYVKYLYLLIFYTYKRNRLIYLYCYILLCWLSNKNKLTIFMLIPKINKYKGLSNRKLNYLLFIWFVFFIFFIPTILSTLLKIIS